MRRKILRKLMGLALTTVMTASMLAGCGSSGETASSATSEAGTESSASSESGEKEVLVLAWGSSTVLKQVRKNFKNVNDVRFILHTEGGKF